MPRCTLLSLAAGVLLGTIALVLGCAAACEVSWEQVTPFKLLALLPGMAILATGVVAAVIFRRPFAELEKQLAAAAQSSRSGELHLAPILGGDAVIAGWNRLSDAWGAMQANAGLHERLVAALEGFRQRKGEHIMNSLPESLAVTDEGGRVSYANASMIALLGHQESSEANLLSLLRLPAASPEATRLRDEAAHERPVVVDVTRSDDDEQMQVLRISRHPLRSDEGIFLGSHVWTIRDISQQRLAESMRNEFVNSVTHELRTPMSSIRAFAETMAETLTDAEIDVEQQKEFCNIINGEVGRLSRLIDDLLSVESMAVGSLTLDRNETDFERLLLETVSKVRPMMDQKDLAFDVKLPPKLPKLKIDKDKIALTLMNLLGNAAKYTPHGGRVGLRCEWTEHEMLIQVQDSGIGIAKDELSRVFERFYRSQDPRVRNQTGTGLGLSLAYEIVRLHGGRLTVESEINQGSTFNMSLPMQAWE